MFGNIPGSSDSPSPPRKRESAAGQQAIKPKHLWLVRTYYLIRTVSFATLFAAIGVHMQGQGYGLAAWGLLMLQFLIYPHLVYYRARIASDPLKVELSSARLDSLLVGIWSAALGFPTWIAFTLFIGTALNNAINKGWRGAL
ncbi:MAG: MASE2 domain-containing protein, partial [Sterolibacterium sp.]